MTAPSVPALRSWLVGRFRTALNATPYSGYSVTYGNPGGVAALKQAWVAVGGTDEQGLVRTLRLQPDRKTNRGESYVLQAVIWTPSPGDWSSAGQQEISEQSWAVAAVLDDCLRDTDPLTTNGFRTGEGLVSHLWISKFDDTEYLDDMQRACQIVLDISCLVTRT